MKKCILSLAGVLLSATFMNAQENSTPVGEIGMTYSFVHRNNEQGQNSYGQNGGSGYFEYNVNKTIGLVGDLGGYDSDNRGRQTFS
jgi:hypothetical protein